MYVCRHACMHACVYACMYACVCASRCVSVCLCGLCAYTKDEFLCCAHPCIRMCTPTTHSHTHVTQECRTRRQTRLGCRRVWKVTASTRRQGGVCVCVGGWVGGWVGVRVHDIHMYLCMCVNGCVYDIHMCLSCMTRTHARTHTHSVVPRLLPPAVALER